MRRLILVSVIATLAGASPVPAQQGGNTADQRPPQQAAPPNSPESSSQDSQSGSPQTAPTPESAPNTGTRGHNDKANEGFTEDAKKEKK